MAHYKAYFTGAGGKFIKAKDIVEADDMDAIISARAMIGGHAIELWERDLKIVAFAAVAISAPVQSERTAP